MQVHNLDVRGEVNARKAVRCDTIEEKTVGAGVTIDGLLIKDGAIPGFGTSDPLLVNDINERTAAQGVTIMDAVGTGSGVEIGTSDAFGRWEVNISGSNNVDPTTGGSGPIEAKYPYMPVSWEGTTPRFAALVLESDAEHVKLLACNLESEDRRVTMRLYELQPGDYRMTRGPDANGDDEMDEITESTEVTVERSSGVQVTLPSRKMQVIRIDKT